jgi:hypothetical protein
MRAKGSNLNTVAEGYREEQSGYQLTTGLSVLTSRLKVDQKMSVKSVRTCAKFGLICPQNLVEAHLKTLKFVRRTDGP